MSSICLLRGHHTLTGCRALVLAWVAILSLAAAGVAAEPDQAELTALLSGEDVAAKAAEHGFVPLVEGSSLAGWKHFPWFEGHWVTRQGVISCDGQIKVKRGQERNLWTEKEYGDFVLVADWRLTGEPKLAERNAFAPEGHFLVDADGKRVRHKILDAGDSGIYLRGSGRYQVNIWSQPMGSGDINAYHKDLKLPPEIRRTYVPKKKADKPFGQWNRFIITMIGNRVWVVLNGQLVIDRAKLPDVPPRGAIALQNHGDPIEFRKIYMKELD